MKHLILSCALIIFIFSCSKNNEPERNEILKSEIVDLQEDIRAASNKLEAYKLQGLTYLDTEVTLKVNEFTEKRGIQSTKVQALKQEFDETAKIETIPSGDFESLESFVGNWDIRKPESSTVEISHDCTYNKTNSLRISVPFQENTFNIPNVEIEGFVNGIEEKTIYKVRFWMKYSGTSDLSNGPLVYMIVTQDGEWLDFLYEGTHQTHKNKVVDKDWQLYSFQISTRSNSPLEIIMGTNLENVCVDDIHIVKKG